VRTFAGTCNAQTCSTIALTLPLTVGDNELVIPCDIVTTRGETNMTPVRRIAAAALVAALGFGVVGMGAAPANAGIDTTWGTKIKAH
jgi:hypothetical protein